MYREDNVIVVVIDPRIFDAQKMAYELQKAMRELYETLEKCFAEGFELLNAVAEKMMDEIAELVSSAKEPDLVPPTINRLVRGSRPASNLTFRRLDRMPWYTSGFQ